MKLYVSGPMTGLPEWNFPAFHAAAAEWRARGHHVVNPAEHFGGNTDLPREDYLREDVALLADCDAIVFLAGWERSAGARLEHDIAVAIGLEILSMPLATEAHETVLQEATRIVDGARRDSYGHPLDNHGTTAEMVTAFLRRKYGAAVPALDAEDVCWFNVLQKVSREANAPKRDNGVDVAGYVRNVELCREERERRAAATA